MTVQLEPYGWQRRTGTLGHVGSVLSRAASAGHLAAHPAVVGTVEGVLGRQLLHRAPTTNRECFVPLLLRVRCATAAASAFATEAQNSRPAPL